MAPRTPYPPDLTDKEWTLIAPSGPTAKPGGRPEKSPPRDILDAIFSILRRGCAWRLLPHDCPPWQIVYPYCWRWQHAGTWQRMPDLLRGDVRVAAGKRRQLSAGIIDRQSVKTTETGGPRRRHAHTCQRPHTAPPRRHSRAAPHGRGHGRQRARPRRGHGLAGRPAAPLFSPARDLGRSGVGGGAHRLGLGATALAQSPPGDGQAPRRDQGRPPAANTLDRGADLRLAWSVPPLIEG
jgi:transposase